MGEEGKRGRRNGEEEGEEKVEEKTLVAHVTSLAF